eukprot:TRINITY_DN37280_c0_g1_i1.p1 TRINITY_DN37280_c0_g1~~TRINITY_DN37280_c0_g1_i1.p1  ORF type:complete len:233 (+),score=9.87 TRINITY_DN37280_c0_g1_i1:80-778(+)
MYLPAYTSSFYAATLTCYFGSYALALSYERSPSVLKYGKPMFFSDNLFARYNDMYPVPFLASQFGCSRGSDCLKNTVGLTLFLFPASMMYGSITAMVLYVVSGAGAMMTWKLQSGINPNKNPTIYDRNLGTSGAICGLAASTMLFPKHTVSPRTPAYLFPLAISWIGYDIFSEYVMPRQPPFDDSGKPVPSIRQWGGAGAAILGGIMGYTILRRRSGRAMGKVFENNMRIKR